MKRDQRIDVRVSAEEKELLQQAAGGARLLSAYLRDLGLQAAQRSEPAVFGTRLLDNPALLAVRGSFTTAKISTACPRERFHRSGVYCGSCNKVIK